MGQTKRLLENLDEQRDEIDRIWSALEEGIATVAAGNPNTAHQLMLHLEDLVSDLHALYWFVWKKCEPDVGIDRSLLLEKAAELATGVLADQWTKWTLASGA